MQCRAPTWLLWQLCVAMMSWVRIFIISTCPKWFGHIQNWYSTKIIWTVQNHFGPIEGQAIRIQIFENIFLKWSVPWAFSTSFQSHLVPVSSWGIEIATSIPRFRRKFSSSEMARPCPIIQILSRFYPDKIRIKFLKKIWIKLRKSWKHVRLSQFYETKLILPKSLSRCLQKITLLKYYPNFRSVYVYWTI